MAGSWWIINRNTAVQDYREKQIFTTASGTRVSILLQKQHWTFLLRGKVDVCMKRALL